MPQIISKRKYTLTNYSRGAAFERKIKKELEAKGYFVVRAAGSRGPVDLLAIRPCFGTRPGARVFDWEVLAIQCKLRKPTKREREAAKQFVHDTNIPIWLRWPEGEEEIG